MRDGEDAVVGKNVLKSGAGYKMGCLYDATEGYTDLRFVAATSTSMLVVQEG